MLAALGRHPLAWKPEDFGGNPDSHPAYLYSVGEDGVAEAEKALETFKELGFDGDEVRKNNFPLPTLGPKLEQVCHDVHSGLGFAIVRGLDPARHTAEDNLTTFLAVASYIGDIQGVQDRRGSMITHITDAGWTVPAHLRHGIHTNSNLEFHSDWGTDILALHVRAPASSGGDTFVASSWTICSELVLAYPEVIDVLQRPDWPVQVSGSPPRYILMPLVRVLEDKLYFAVDPGRLGLHPAFKTGGDSLVPNLSPEQRQALDLVSTFASKHQLRLNVEAGDMVFLNNWSILHARDAYVDSEDGPRRHLVRLWLRNSRLGWAVPDDMKAPWEAAFGPRGDGNPVFIKGQKHWPVVPAREYTPPKYTAGSAAFVMEDSEDVNAGAA
ncbi:hypothetical protein QBC34DRAFT_304485 [Podospora aff. communis PSN243]|uniref:TauD/TfdA-like domain-containing protein n=1 Tax=Podospora aff. communis PSN243 TaxID=3040156 RepID=A0AAV9GFE8_9PEZI|nr:hypothetical protein QBC34DRAFT_304485 [Podospora aff. communis PSN243]